jgi:metal-responsive CopG/Arc/MetJ family transcriptional regulator
MAEDKERHRLVDRTLNERSDAIAEAHRRASQEGVNRQGILLALAAVALVIYATYVHFFSN